MASDALIHNKTS